ncbi:putative WRKY transcription factor 50 [Ananas comosus]|uniref:Putative WRKY transcription factor 50 n=1 Tax=Ananas comosus TaxID=4615 RepID=A0A199UVT7_ANACO|nr:putative WRKY transcription factor 50 [Ananas comosus]
MITPTTCLSRSWTSSPSVNIREKRPRLAISPHFGSRVMLSCKRTAAKQAELLVVIAASKCSVQDLIFETIACAYTIFFNIQFVCRSQSARASSSKGGRMKVAFKTKSELEVLDDGYKWRKYGKKMVKNSPNPRNYYRCSSDGCNVKKRVQREKEDSRYVITTYEGVHNHHALLPASADYEASGKDTLANCFQESHV